MISDPRLYVQLADEFRMRIEKGELAPGEMLPSIGQVCAERRYSRQTVGRAWRALERDGLAARVPGLGYFVSGRA